MRENESWTKKTKAGSALQPDTFAQCFQKTARCNRNVLDFWLGFQVAASALQGLQLQKKQLPPVLQLQGSWHLMLQGWFPGAQLPENCSEFFAKQLHNEMV